MHGPVRHQLEQAAYELGARFLAFDQHQDARLILGRAVVQQLQKHDVQLSGCLCAPAKRGEPGEVTWISRRHRQAQRVPAPALCE